MSLNQSNHSPSCCSHLSAIDNDNNSNTYNSNYSCKSNSKLVGGEEVVTASGVSNDESGSYSSANSGFTTKGTYEGLASLQPHYAAIITDCFKNVFTINEAKD